jgi:hypothetical protein
MTERIELRPRFNEERIKAQIASRVKDCFTDKCWIVRPPERTNQYIWLRPQDLIKGKRGRLVAIKRLEYYMSRDYAPIPLKHIKNHCGHKWCVNPSHCYIPGFEPRYGLVNKWLIEKKYLSPENAQEWYNDVDE